jgi:hypothetical protein
MLQKQYEGMCAHGVALDVWCDECDDKKGPELAFDVPTGPLAAFDAAIQKVTQERGATYGHPADDFAKASKIKEAVAACPDPLLRHCLEMIGVKLARLAQTPEHLDSWIDVFGYARCAVMIIDRRAKEPKEWR